MKEVYLIIIGLIIGSIIGLCLRQKKISVIDQRTGQKYEISAAQASLITIYESGRWDITLSGGE